MKSCSWHCFCLSELKKSKKEKSCRQDTKKVKKKTHHSWHDIEYLLYSKHTVYKCDFVHWKKKKPKLLSKPDKIEGHLYQFLKFWHLFCNFILLSYLAITEGPKTLNMLKVNLTTTLYGLSFSHHYTHITHLYCF